MEEKDSKLRRYGKLIFNYTLYQNGHGDPLTKDEFKELNILKKELFTKVAKQKRRRIEPHTMHAESNRTITQSEVFLFGTVRDTFETIQKSHVLSVAQQQLLSDVQNVLKNPKTKYDHLFLSSLNKRCEEKHKV